MIFDPPRTFFFDFRDIAMRAHIYAHALPPTAAAAGGAAALDLVAARIPFISGPR